MIGAVIADLMVLDNAPATPPLSSINPDRYTPTGLGMSAAAAL
jgi:hypothetical protein